MTSNFLACSLLFLKYFSFWIRICILIADPHSTALHFTSWCRSSWARGRAPVLLWGPPGHSQEKNLSGLQTQPEGKPEDFQPQDDLDLQLSVRVSSMFKLLSQNNLNSNLQHQGKLCLQLNLKVSSSTHFRISQTFSQSPGKLSTWYSLNMV